MARMKPSEACLSTEYTKSDGRRDESCGPLGTSLLARGRLSVKARMGLPGCAEAQAAACQVTRGMRREHVCVVLPLAALLHAVAGGPVGQAVQVAPVLLPVRDRTRRIPCARRTTTWSRRARRHSHLCAVQRMSGQSYCY